jgi:hypothetical protein
MAWNLRRYSTTKSPIFGKAVSKIENLRESEALIKKAHGELFDGKNRGRKSRVRVLLTAF